MNKEFTVIKLSEEKDPIIICSTLSRYEAKNRFNKTPLAFGEKVELRSFVDGKIKILGERNNGFCA